MRRLAKDEAVAFVERERVRLLTETERCLMCVLGRADRDENLVVAENDHATLRLNRLPSRRSELMVILRRHAEQNADVRPDEYLALYSLAHRAACTLERHRGALRVFVAQLGAPDEVLTSYPHVHVHVLPLYEGGDASRPARVFSWSDAIHGYDDGEAEAEAASLRHAFGREP